MATVHVSIFNALSNEELLSETFFPVAELAAQVKSTLGSRPSRPLTLFHNGVIVEHVLATAGERLQLTACVGMALDTAHRVRRIQKLRKAYATGERDAARMFAGFTEVERDDDELVLLSLIHI